MLHYNKGGARLFSNEYRRLGARICYYRMLRCMSQEDLATACNISQSYLSRIEHGSIGKSVSYTTILGIAAALNIDVVELVKKEI